MDNNEIKTKIQTASREQLVLMLYDGAMRFCDEGKVAILTKDYERAHDRLIRSQNIVLELLYALDRKAGGAVADNLAELYQYCYQCLVSANISHEAAKCDECRAILLKLRDAWKEAVDKLKER